MYSAAPLAWANRKISVFIALFSSKVNIVPSYAFFTLQSMIFFCTTKAFFGNFLKMCSKLLFIFLRKKKGMGCYFPRIISEYK